MYIEELSAYECLKVLLENPSLELIVTKGLH